MKKTTYFELNTQELNAKLNELKAELFNLRFKHSTNQLPNANVIVVCKKDIAKVKTILRQRELGISFEPAKTKKSTKTSAVKK
ncbi:MAG: 50S ribosomal protein L29 [Clostridia bacterium]